MKKIMAISAIVAFTVAGFAEARGGRSGGFGGSSSRAVVSKPFKHRKHNPRNKNKMRPLKIRQIELFPTNPNKR